MDLPELVLGGFARSVSPCANMKLKVDYRARTISLVIVNHFPLGRVSVWIWLGDMLVGKHARRFPIWRVSVLILCSRLRRKYGQGRIFVEQMNK